MATVADIRWGKYRQYEGPFYMGKHRMFPVTKDSPLEHKYIAVITATEGGRFDAINMYDRMIISAGLIQWAEAGIFSVSSMLGHVEETMPSLMYDFVTFCADRGYRLTKLVTTNSNNAWRFVDIKSSKVIDTIPAQRSLFLGASDGTAGSWDKSSRAWAKGWAAAVASVFEKNAAQEAQITFTVPRLHNFLRARGKELVLADPVNEYHAAGQAAFLSFAANLPAVAEKNLDVFYKEKILKVDEFWLLNLLHKLTFGVSIDIYPHRYTNIRPVLERLYGVKLPEVQLLRDCKKSPSKDTQSRQGSPDELSLSSVTEVQRDLIYLGYDLGPHGADGVLGSKTRNAIMSFQETNKLKVDGIVGPATRAALVAQFL